MNTFEDVRQHRRQVVMDAARFIGSHSQEALRGPSPCVTGLDIFASALGPVEHPARTNATNVASFLNMRSPRAAPRAPGRHAGHLEQV